MLAWQREWMSALARRGGRHAGNPEHDDGGAASIEFALVFPVLLLLLLGIVYYGTIFAMQQLLTLAAEEAARAALRYPAAGTTRVAAAQGVAAATISNVLPSFLAGQVQTSTPLADCPNLANTKCLSVVLTLPLTTGSNPLLPAIPLVPVPTSITGTAVVQLVAGT